MNILDLHEIRDGILGESKRLRRAFNPFIHLSEDEPLMRVLYTITRSVPKNATKKALAVPHSFRKPLIHAAGVVHEKFEETIQKIEKK
jgi:hypothetical protein